MRNPRLTDEGRESEQERQFWFKHKNDDALFMVTTSERRRRVWAGAHAENRTPWASEEMMQEEGEEEEEGRIDDILRWCRRAGGGVR